MAEPRPLPARTDLPLDGLLARSALAAELKQQITDVGFVASGSSYWDAVNDALMLLRGTDPQALKLANVEKRKARRGW